MQEIDKNTWKILRKGLTFCGIFPTFGQGSHPSVLLDLPAAAQDAVREIWSDPSLPDAEIYSFDIDGALGYCVFKRTNQGLNSKRELFYSDESMDDVVAACRRQCQTLAAYPLPRWAWAASGSDGRNLFILSIVFG